ncbi:MFS transporter [Rickettsiales bacterium LUAb2]
MPDTFNNYEQSNNIKEGDKRSSFRWVIIILLFFIILINFIDRSAVSFALDNLKAEFNLSDTQLGLILGIFGAGYIITMFFGGIMADKKGAKKVFTVTIILWGLSMFSMAASFSFTMLLLSRFFLGVSEGPAYPSNFRVLADWIPINQRATAATYVAVAIALSTAIGSLLITNLMYEFDWRLTFVILGILSLVWVPFWNYYFTDKPWDSKYVTQDELAIITNRKGNFLAKEGNDNISPTMWRYLLVSPTYRTDEILAKDKILPENHWKYLLTNKTLLSTYYSNFATGFLFFFFLGWLPTYFKRTYHMDIREDGLFTMLPWVLDVIFMLLGARVFDYILKKTGKFRYARSYPIMIGWMLSISMLIPLGLIDNPSLSLSVILISIAVACMGPVGLIYYISAVDMAKRRAATATAITGATLGLAGFIAPTLTGFLIDITGNFKMGFLLIAILGSIAVIVIALFHKPDEIDNTPITNKEELENPYYDYLKDIKKYSQKKLSKKDRQISKKAKKLKLTVNDINK